MNSFLLLMYFSIGVASTTLLTIVIRYLKSKALQKQSVQDQTFIDLAIIVGLTTDTICSVMILRELIGPFQIVVLVTIIFSVAQYLYVFMLTGIVSVQLTQVSSVFFSAEMSEWGEEVLILIHRIFVLSFGFSTGSLICYNKGGMCGPTPIYYYVLKEYKEPGASQFEIQSIMLIGFMLIIALCQMVIEWKRFMMNRDQDRAANLAASASRQLEKATKQLRMEPPSELGVRFLPFRVEIAWEGMSGRSIERTNRGIASNQNEIQTEPVNNLSTKKQAITIARFVCLFGLAPALVTMFNMLVSDKYGIRPHGSTGTFLSIYGVVIPSLIIFNNLKMKAFAKDFLLFKR